MNPPPASWAELDRAAATRLVNGAHSIGARAALAAGDHIGRQAGLAESLLDADPYDEAALRLLMAAHAGAGRPGSALAVYARVPTISAEDLGVDPSPATEKVHTAILREEAVPGLPVGPVPGVKRRRRGSPSSLPAIMPAPARGQPLRLAGRDGPLASLDAAYARSTAGDFGILAVEGDAAASGPPPHPSGPSGLVPPGRRCCGGSLRPTGAFPAPPGGGRRPGRPHAERSAQAKPPRR